MKKYGLTVLLVLASLAMLGIVVLQARWLEDSLRTRHALRKERVRASVQRVAEQLQYQDAAALLKDKFRGMADTLQSLQEAMRITDYQMGTFADANNSGKIPLPSKTPRNNRYYLRIQESYDTLIFMMDTIIMRRMLPRMYADTLGAGKERAARDSLNPRANLAPLVDQYRVLLDSSRKLLDRVFVQMIASNDSLERHLDSTHLYNFLRHELSQHGLEGTAFGYKLTQLTEKGVARTVYMRLDPEASWQDSVRVQVFTHNPFFGQSALTVYYPRDYIEILQGMWGNLVMSLVLLMGVGAAFLYTVRSLLRQKKLAQMKTDFINNMTHELKTPIATISLATEVLEQSDAAASHPQMLRYTAMIRQESQRLHNQVNRVLQAAEFQHKKPLEPEPQDLAVLLQQAVSAFTLQLEQRNADFILDIPAHPLPLMADSVHLPQAVANLLDNALKYSPGRPYIRLQVTVQDGQAVITVSDRGLGMDELVQKRIFEPFYRAQTGNRQDTRGYGLGLSYVKGVIEGHHGTITVDSQPGQGTTFTLILPLTP
ncbi:MAG: HAMP domain-containing histidine kinase [Bacteroidetes bacterium]|nr:HAMP domain-containing histidine kinase [Bacteroidota bacterium]